MNNIRIASVLATLLLVSTATQASTVTITPEDCISGSCWTTEDNSTLTTSEVEALIGTTDLEQLYKSDQSDTEGSVDSGLFADSYDTTFSNTVTDPEDALIQYISGVSITCDECYLLLKDGNHNPAQYIFDLSDLSYLSIGGPYLGAWDGIMELFADGFWPDGGAISHVSIYGTLSVIPLPAAFWLFGTALIGFVGVSRRRAV